MSLATSQLSTSTSQSSTSTSQFSAGKQKIAIIGAGFTGLAAADDLVNQGHQVKIFETNDYPGGLAAGFKKDNWQWSVEHHYHHVFATDKHLQNWLGRLGLLDSLFYQDTQSYSFNHLGMVQLDSALSLLRYPHLSLLSKLRTGAVLAFLKLWPWGKFLEGWTAHRFLQMTMGQAAWQELWQPLFVAKFGQFASQVNAAWFWARIYARSKQLGYYRGGFLQLAQDVVEKLRAKGVDFCFKTSVTKVSKHDGGVRLNFLHQQPQTFDQVLMTGSSQQLLALTDSQLPHFYQESLQQHRTLAAMTMVLELDEPFFKEDFKDLYWLNINRTDWPFLGLVEHTNFIDSDYYNDCHLLYIGKYLSADDPFFTKNKQQVFQAYLPYLQELAQDIKEHVEDIHLFKAQAAQPVVGVNHSRRLPGLLTPLPGLTWASMQHIYPYDRGINYAVALGQEVAQTMV